MAAGNAEWRRAAGALPAGCGRWYALGPGRAFDLQALVDAAAPGDTIPVPAGIYAAPLVIDKPLTLVGDGMPVIQGDGTGDVVEITAPDVTLRGFVVRGSGDSLDREHAGITVGGAPSSRTTAWRMRSLASTSSRPPIA